MSSVTIAQAKEKFLEAIKSQRSTNTLQAYDSALESFSSMLRDQQRDISTLPVAKLNEDSIVDFVIYIKKLSPSTESLYLQVLKNFFEFLNAEHLAKLNISHVRRLMRERTRRLRDDGSEEYPEDQIKRLIESMVNISQETILDHNKPEMPLLRDTRDSALILILADTGIRVDEVCHLKIGDIDWVQRRVSLKGRGKKQGFVRLSTRVIKALRKYLDLRANLDKGTGHHLSTLPLFARHDRGAGKKIKPVTSTTIRNIVSDRVNQILGLDAVGLITPHTFLHYFVTTILRATGNLKLAQVLARHSNIQVTQRYAHLSDDELDKGYHEIFEKKR